MLMSSDILTYVHFAIEQSLATLIIVHTHCSHDTLTAPLIWSQSNQKIHITKGSLTMTTRNHFSLIFCQKPAPISSLKFHVDELSQLTQRYIHFAIKTMIARGFDNENFSGWCLFFQNFLLVFNSPFKLRLPSPKSISYFTVQL